LDNQLVVVLVRNQVVLVLNQVVLVRNQVVLVRNQVVLARNQEVVLKKKHSLRLIRVKVMVSLLMMMMVMVIVIDVDIVDTVIGTGNTEIGMEKMDTETEIGTDATTKENVVMAKIRKKEIQSVGDTTGQIEIAMIDEMMGSEMAIAKDDHRR